MNHYLNIGFLILVLFFCNAFETKAQDNRVLIDSNQLIANPSFETYFSCPQRPGQMNLCADWNSLRTIDSPDFWCVNCDSIANGISFDPSYPKDGNCFATIVVRNGKYYAAQEHIQNNLTSKLAKDSIYQLSFYVRTGEGSNYFTDRFSVAFTPDSGSSSFSYVNKKKYWLPMYKKAILIKDKSFYSKDFQWQKISLIYKANGDEQYITIGIFANHLMGYKRQNRFKTKIGNGTNHGYYDLDNFSLILIPK